MSSPAPEASTSKGKGKARAARVSPSVSPSPSPPPLRRTYRTRRSTVGEPALTAEEYPLLLNSLDTLGNYLDPGAVIDGSGSLPDQLSAFISTLAPHILTAYSDYHVCHNADLADFCLQVSFLMRRVAPDQFFYLLNANDDKWSWLSDGIPTVRFQGFQSTGDPVLAVAREVFSFHAARALREEAETLEAAEAPEGPLPESASGAAVVMDDHDEEFAPEEPSHCRRRRHHSRSAGPTTRRMGVMDRPGTVLEHSYLLPPLGVRPCVAFEKKKPPKADSLPRVEAPGELPIYRDGPLFRQGEGLSELTLPIQQGTPPDWSSQHLFYAGEDSPINITSLVSDSLNLRSMAQIAAAQADDLIKMTEAKVGTLSLVMQRVYACRGDAGLNDYFRNVRGFSELLEFAHRVPLDTPMLFPRRLNATTMQPDEVEYRWSTDYEDSIYFRPPAASDDEMEVDPASGPAPPDEEDDLGEGPSTQPAAASSSAPAASTSNVNPLIGLAAKRRRGE
ncbi:hypothetical protein H1R20_g15891, partial [Candolleomyces eurysporus]